MNGAQKCGNQDLSMHFNILREHMSNREINEMVIRNEDSLQIYDDTNKWQIKINWNFKFVSGGLQARP
jgi:hypothetical protein